jgi:outer membrane protein assembly factor BamB
MSATRSLALLLVCASGLVAADWPQWRGPDRAAVVTDFKPPTTWPKELTKKWSTPIGDGVATPALVGDRLYTFSYQDGKEITRCLDAGSGKEVWKNEYATQPARPPANSFPAARSSPAVAEGKVVTLGVQGTLSCLDSAKGTVIWRKNSTGGTPQFATSCSPLLVEGLCIVQVGGDKGGGSVAAYTLADGKEKWKWTSDGTKFSSPTLATLDGLKAIFVETAGTISAVNLADGHLLWSTPFQTRYNAASPMIEGNILYYAGSGKPTTAVELDKQGDKLTSKELWSNKDNSVQYNTPVIKDGLLFGISEGNALFCIDTKSGKTLWSKQLGTGGGPGGGAGGGRPGRGGMGRGGYGSVVAAGPVLFALTPNTPLVVFKPDREGFKQIASYKVADGGTYAYPVVTNEGVYIKDKNAVTFWTFQ